MANLHFCAPSFDKELAKTLGPREGLSALPALQSAGSFLGRGDGSWVKEQHLYLLRHILGAPGGGQAESSGLQRLFGPSASMPALTAAQPTLVTPAARPAPARLLAAEARPPTRAPRRRAGLVVPSSRVAVARSARRCVPTMAAPIQSSASWAPAGVPRGCGRCLRLPPSLGAGRCLSPACLSAAVSTCPVRLWARLGSRMRACRLAPPPGRVWGWTDAEPALLCRERPGGVAQGSAWVLHDLVVWGR